MVPREARDKAVGYASEYVRLSRSLYVSTKRKWPCFPLSELSYVYNIPAKAFNPEGGTSQKSHALGCLGFPLPLGQLVVVWVPSPLVQRFPLGVISPRLEPPGT